MKEFTIKLVADRLADLRDSHKLRIAQLKNHNAHVAKLTEELADLQKQIADLEADLQASNITVTEVAERAAFESVRKYRDYVVKSFAVPADILKGAPQKKGDHVTSKWSHHTGGPQPVDGKKKVSVILRSGLELAGGPAERYDWSHNKPLERADIILWREVD
jgi:uncharacterized protein YdcH (DUF465 family)